MLPFLGIVIMVIGEWGCSMHRNGRGGGNQSEITKYLKQIVEHSNPSGKFHFVNYK